MASVNKVILVGNLGRDPEMRYLPSGEAVVNLSVATTDKYKDKSGAMQEATEWHRVSFFGRTAEVCGQYLKKGSQVYVEGSIRTRKYTDKDGVEKYATEIRGDRMQMLGGRAGGGMADMDDGGYNQAPPPRSPSGGQRSVPAARPASSGFDDMDDDIPF
ncbi:MAG: single-stranded DNA-binding protein [Thiobacillus sp. 65-69]|nr:single-stranded DNA-binding protein [Thiobacillus sp.]ODU87323.1 MAG: single-stranded DNA-binding protein [Thiobacillus sp. SCN 65-179]OJW37228.1 MAG: single-stranded DNA-binding protein [Thiobacillus sp. 65-69]